MFEFDLPGIRFSASDNFFELYPGEAKEVEVKFSGGATLPSLRKSIGHRSLADTY
jgi:beta-mannosidase